MGRPIGSRNKVKSKAKDSSQPELTREISRKVYDLRTHLGLTSTDLAVKMGLSQGQVSRLENGKQGFRSQTLTRIAEVLGVKPSYFFLENKKVTTEDMVSESKDVYGPGVPAELKEALKSPKFKQYVVKCANIFMEDEISFSKLSTLVRKTKVKRFQ